MIPMQVLVVCVFISACVAAIPIKLGLLLPVNPGLSGTTTGKTWIKIAQIAEANINNNSYIPGYNMELVVYDTMDDPPGAVGAAMQSVLTQCTGVVGGDISFYSELIQYVLQNYHIPQVSPLSTSTLLSDKSQFPTFLRTIPGDDASGPIIAKLIKYFDWHQVGLIVGSDPYSASLYSSFTKASRRENITLVVETFLEQQNIDYAGHVTKLKNAYTQIIVIFAEQIDLEEVFLQAHAQGILGKDFVWIGPDTMHAVNVSRLEPGALRGTLAVSPTPVTTGGLADMYMDLMSQANISDAYGGFIFDAVYTYANAFNTMLKTSSNSEPWKDPAALLAVLRTTMFSGVSGEIYFDDAGDRIPATYDVLDFQQGGLVTVAQIDMAGNFTHFAPVIWADGSTKVPLDYLHVLKNSPVHHVKSLFIALAAIMLFVLVLLFITFVFFISMKELRVTSGVTQFLVHVANTVGGILGYAAIIIIVAGVSKVHCTAAAILLDLSLLVCGGVLSLRTVKKFIQQYRDHSQRHVVPLKAVHIILYGTWVLLVAFNVFVLIGTMTYVKPSTQLHLLEQNIYEYQCKFGKLAIVILPISIGLIFIFSLVTTLLKILVNTTVATKKSDILFSVYNIITLFALIIAVVTLVLIEPSQTQIDITICIIILIANLTVPTNLVGWFLSPKRLSILFKKQNYLSSPPPDRQPAIRKSISHIHTINKPPSASDLNRRGSSDINVRGSSDLNLRGSAELSTLTAGRTHRESVNAAELGQI